MKIQNSVENIESRRIRLFKSAMIYIVLFAIGICMYVGQSHNNGQKTIFDSVLGVYTAGDSASTAAPSKEQILSELDNFNTLKIDNNANLPSCENVVTKTNGGCNDSSCQQSLKDGKLVGWLSLSECTNGKQHNENVGCTTGAFTGAAVHTISVKDIPVLDFLADTSVNKKNNSNDAFKYTQAPCFYNMFKNPFSSEQYENPLSFSIDQSTDGPVFALSSSGKIAIVPYPALATGSQCWGFNPSNFTDTAHFDIKAFLEKYREHDTLGQDNQDWSLDNLWGLILSLFQNKFDKAVKDDPNNAKDFNIGGKTELCTNLPGGAVTKLNYLKTENSPKYPYNNEDIEYEVTRKVYEYTKAQMCEMMLNSPDKLLGDAMECTVSDSIRSFNINRSNRGKIYNEPDWRWEEYYDPVEHRWKYRKVEVCNDVTMCGKTWQCEETIEQVYNYCKSDPNRITKFAGNNLKIKITSDSFPYINLPNGMRMLRNAYDLAQTVAPYSIKIGNNIGIEMKTTYRLYDVNSCKSCNYGSNLIYRKDAINFDPTTIVDSSLKQYIDVEKNQPYSVQFTGKGDLNYVTASDSRSTVKGSTNSEVSYIFPYVGNLPQMYEMISNYLTNMSNEDTGSTLVEYLMGKAPLPKLKNETLKNVVLKLCKDEVYDPAKKIRNDCLDPNGKYMLTDESNDNGVVNPGDVSSNLTGIGIDVSHHNGNINWSDVASDPQDIQFAIIKATDGLNTDTGYIDSKFVDNWNGAGDAGLSRTAYHYFIGNISGSAQAEFFLRTVEGVGATPTNLDAPLAIDVEETNNGGIGAEELTTNLKDMVDTMIQRGYTPMIYTRADAWASMTTSPSWAGDLPLWIAAWHNPGSDPTAYNPGTLPTGWSDWLVWQYAGDDPAGPIVKVNGISGIVDADVANVGTRNNINTNKNKVNYKNTTKTTQAVLGATNTREDDIDTLGTYLKAKVYRKNYAKLFASDEVISGTGSGTIYFPPDPSGDGSGIVYPPGNYPPITTNPMQCETATVQTCQSISNGIATRFNLVPQAACYIENHTNNYCQWHGLKGGIGCDQELFDTGYITSRLLFHELIHNSYNVVSEPNCVSELKASILEAYYYSSCSLGDSNYKFIDRNNIMRRSGNILSMLQASGATADDIWRFVRGERDLLSLKMKEHPEIFGNLKNIEQLASSCYM